jgi:hypothetical protein
MTNRLLSMACILSGGFAGLVHGQDANRDTVNTVTDAHTIVRKLADRTGEFKNDFDKAIEHSMMDGTKLEDRAKHRADDLHDSAKKLQDVFGEKRDKNDPKVRDQVDKTLAAAADVNRLMTDHRFTDKLQHQWELLRVDLNALAAVYDLSPLK